MSIFEEEGWAENLKFINKCMTKVIQMFKNNVPQRKIQRDLYISDPKLHNIKKKEKEIWRNFHA